jgi:hypothetical protein
MPARPAARAAALLVLLPAVAAANPLAGTWRGVQEGEAVEITLGAGGRFARRDAARDGTVMTLSGRWSIADRDGRSLRLAIEDWAPRRACGLLGCTPVRMPPGATCRYRLQGADTLLLEDAGGRIALRRAGLRP